MINVDEIKTWEQSVSQLIKDLKLNLLQLRNLEQRCFGRKGEWQQWYKKCCNLTKDHGQRTLIFKTLNNIKTNLKNKFSSKFKDIMIESWQSYWGKSKIDPTLPPIVDPLTGQHPLFLVHQKLISSLQKLGYCQILSSEIETFKYNFTRLNIDKTHPLLMLTSLADPNQEVGGGDVDSFVFASYGLNTVARTHTTTSTARLLEQIGKIKSIKSLPRMGFFTSGPVFRRDDDDATHSHQFQQLDVLAIGLDLKMNHLIGTVDHLLGQVLGSAVKTRIRSTYFPFTEPSFEVDVYDPVKQEYVEVLGGGMINSAVMKLANCDPKLQAFAFGIGIERLTMVKFGLNNLHDFYRNDMRWLSQFRKSL